MDIAGYCRISVDEEQDQENTSIENQKTIISDFVRQKFPGAALTLFEDRDRSGYTFEQREGYQRLRAALREGRFSILVVKDFSRFSRRNSLGLYELELLRDEGIRIISIGDGVDYPTHDDWLSIQFRFLMNEMPVTDTSKKVRAVIKSRQAKGEWICGAPYGYYLHPLQKGELCVDEEGAEVVPLIYRLYLKGWGYKKIAEYLTAQGYPTGLQLRVKQFQKQGRDASGLEHRASPVWNSNSVAGIIGNDFYIGTLRQGQWRRQGINKADRRVPESEQTVFPNHHPPILTNDLFAQVVEQLRQRTKTNYRGVKKYAHTYTGFLFCADCESPMFGVSYPHRPAGYMCGAYHRRGLKGCTSHHIHEQVIDESVRNYIRVVRDSMLEALEQLDEERSAAQSGRLSQRLGDIRAQREEIGRELQGSTRERIRQVLKNPDREEQIHETFDALERDYHQVLDRLKRQEELLAQEAEQRTGLKKSIDRVLETFDALLHKERFERQDVATIIERILVGQEKLLVIELKSDIGELIGTLNSAVGPGSGSEGCYRLDEETTD